MKDFKDLRLIGLSLPMDKESLSANIGENLCPNFPKIFLDLISLQIYNYSRKKN